MARISGVHLPDNKRIEIALTYIYGIGRSSSNKILQSAKIDHDTKTKDLTDTEIRKITDLVGQLSTEGDLRRMVQLNIKRLKDIGCYRGLRHIRRLPLRGQRTKTNARTKRGKRVTVGSGRRKETKK